MLLLSFYVSALVRMCVWCRIAAMIRSRCGCTAAVSGNQMAEQSVMRQTTETQSDPEDLKGRQRREGGQLKG